MKWRRELTLGIFPVLAALYPVLALTARNSEGGFVSGFGRAVLGAVVVGAAAWALSALLTRDPDRRLLASLAAVVWFSFFGVLERAAQGTELSSRPAILVASLLVAGAVVGWVVRTPRPLSAAARVARLTTGLVLAFPLFALASQQLRSPDRPAEPAAAPVAAADSTLPSIYFILLDKYSGSRSLAANYGYDNGPFEGRLQRMGFTVRREAKPNYPHTWLSMPSMLNWRYAEQMLAGQPQDQWMATLRRAAEDNRTARYLKSRGYEYVFVPSSFPFTQSSPLADRVVADSGRTGGMDVWGAWLAETPLRRPRPAAASAPPAAGPRATEPEGLERFPYDVETAAEVEARLDAISALASERGRPRFVFAHLLVPHEPYVWRLDCTPRAPYWPARDYGPQRQQVQRAYLEQVNCLNQKLEKMVAEILQRSAVPPVILLQSDHGHAFMALDPMTGSQPPRSQLQPTQVTERMDAFAAYHLPGNGASALYDSMTAVNLFPVVLNHYLQAGIPVQEDHVFWATLFPPFNLTRLR
jgi:hypothetical protein